MGEMPKRCAYCHLPIHGASLPIGDDAGSGAHIPAYWHANPAECGPKASSTAPLDTLRSPLELHVTRALRARSS